jgi:hypothetical protein
MISIKCNCCGETYKAEEQHVGRRIRCRCGNVLEIVAHVYPPDLSGAREPMDPSSSSRHVGTILRRIQQVTARGWLVYATVIVVIVSLFGVYRIITPSQETTTNVRRPAPAITAPAAATVKPALVPWPSEALVRPVSGAELGGRYRGGLGKMQIANGTSFDAVAVLVDDSTKTPRRAIFVRQGESGSITALPPGHYRLRFQLGTDWLTERRFCRLLGTSEFEGVFDYAEVKSDEGIKYSAHEVTLHPVPAGTAKIKVIDNSSFELPPP